MIARLRDYGRVYAAFWRTSLLAELEYRAHFVTLSLTSLLWSAASLALLGLIFRNVRAVGGWTEGQMWLLTGTFMLSQALADVFLSRNMGEFSRLINRGELDFVLTRPLDSQFIVSTRYVSFRSLSSVLLGLVVVVVGAGRAGVTVTPAALALYGVLVLAGLVITYALWFMSVTLIVFSGRINNIAALMHALFEVGRVPMEVYGPLLRAVLTLVLPFAFLAAVPAQGLLGLLDWPLALYGIAAAALFLTASHLFWRFALRRYASASS